MTLVIRTADALSAPVEGAKVLPPLAGVTGIHARFNADHFTGANGAAITSWVDGSGNSRSLAETSGTIAATQDTTTTARRTVKLVGAGVLRTPVLGVASPTGLTIGARIYVGANPTGSQYIAGVTPFATLLAMSWGGYAARGFTGTYPQGAAVTKPAWVTVVATFDTVGGTGKIVTNGTVVSAAQTYTGMTDDQRLALSGSSHAAGVLFREVVFLDHVADATEITALTTALNAA